MFADKGSIRYFRLGRHALYTALKMLHLGPGDRVLLPGFICRALLAPIHSAGMQPFFYHTSVNLCAESLPHVDKVRAVLAVNYFGFPQNLAIFRNYCAQAGALLIEDNAHGFLSQDSEGYPLGSRGDLGLLSMRKTLTIPDGAALRVNRNDLVSLLPPQLPCRNEGLQLMYHAGRALAVFQRRTGIPGKSIAQDIVQLARRMRTGHAIAQSRPEDERYMPLGQAPHCKSLEILQRVDVASERLRRRQLYEVLDKELSKIGVQPIFDRLLPGVAPYGYPFRADIVTVQRAAKVARSLGLNCIHWPDLPTVIEYDAPDYYKNVWLVNFLC